MVLLKCAPMCHLSTFPICLLADIAFLLTAFLSNIPLSPRQKS